jgi:hypothetical protein
VTIFSTVSRAHLRCAERLPARSRVRRVTQNCQGHHAETRIANSVDRSHRAPLCRWGRAEVRALSLAASRPDERAPRRRARACHPWRASATTRLRQQRPVTAEVRGHQDDEHHSKAAVGHQDDPKMAPAWLGEKCAPRTTTRNDGCLPGPAKSAYGVAARWASPTLDRTCPTRG